mmetsp:Transcript_19242/g.41349  ORF Transcript_19242/g.41349 Transcript_19242/m.41349 type:complete len:330 (+) Transcript_19242:155-1144(+)
MHAVNDDSICLFTDSIWSEMNSDSKEPQTRSSIIPLTEEDCDPFDFTSNQAIEVTSFHLNKEDGESQGAARNLQMSQLQNLNLDFPVQDTNNKRPAPSGFIASSFQSLKDDTFESSDAGGGANAQDVPTAADLIEEVIRMSLFENTEGPAACSDEEDKAGTDTSSVEGRFRSYQSGQWSARFAELVEYKKKMGHCLVPHNYEENLPLARWVKRQRCQYRRMTEGQHSTISQDRKRALDEIGFVWDYQGDAWEEKLTELRHYRSNYGNCDVPYHFEENPKLAVWVKCQRRQYKLFMEGKHSSMTHERISDLETLGFRWELRSYNKKRRLS